jgi:hypothetical protein
MKSPIDPSENQSVPRPSAGENTRRRELSIGPVGPWGAVITVWAVSTNHGRHSSRPHDWLFEVQADWTGPPAVGFPPSPTPVSSRDVYVLEDLGRARWLANRAAEYFRHGGDDAPDLRALANVK